MSIYLPMKHMGNSPPGVKKSRPGDDMQIFGTEERAVVSTPAKVTGKPLNSGSGQGWYSLLSDERTGLIVVSSSGSPATGMLTQFTSTISGSGSGTSFTAVRSAAPLVYNNKMLTDRKSGVQFTMDTKLGPASLMCWSADCLISCAYDRGLVLCFNEKLEEESRISVHDTSITGMTAGAKGHVVTTCSSDRSIAQSELESGVIKRRISSAHRSHVLSIAALPSADSDIFISCGKDRGIVTWDMRDRSPGKGFVTFPTGGDNCPSALSFYRPDERYFMAGTCGGTFILFDVRNNASEVQSVRLGTSARVRRVKRLTGVTGQPDLIALITDDSVLNLMKESSLEVIYSGSESDGGWTRDVEVISGRIQSVGTGRPDFVLHTI